MRRASEVSPQPHPRTGRGRTQQEGPPAAEDRARSGSPLCRNPELGLQLPEAWEVSVRWVSLRYRALRYDNKQTNSVNKERVFLFIGSPSCCHRGNGDPRGRDFCGTCGGCAPREGTPQGSVRGRVSWDGRMTPRKRAPMAPSDLWQPLFQLAGLLLLPVGPFLPCPPCTRGYSTAFPGLLRGSIAVQCACHYHCVSAHTENSSLDTLLLLFTHSLQIQPGADLLLNLALPPTASPSVSC